MFDVSGLTEVKMQKRNGWQGSYYVDKHDICQAKTCARCKEIVRAELFGPDKHRKYGLKMYCRDCSPSVAGTHRTRSDAQIEADRARVRPNGTKRCHMCKEHRPFEMFSASRAKIDGLAARCKLCDKSFVDREYNVDRAKHYKKSYRSRLSLRSDHEIDEDREKVHHLGVKTCRKCKIDKPFCDFYTKRSERDGLRDSCIPCDKQRTSDLKKKPYVDYWANHGIPLECYVCGGTWSDADHVIPENLGGSDDLSNRLPMCEPCNSSKWKTPLKDWIRKKYPDIADEVLYRVGIVYGVVY